jgi:NADH-quinone oxidoreductase subunit J
MSAGPLLFYLFAGFTILASLGMVLNIRNTVASAMSLVVAMISLGAIYVLLDAYLVAAIQIMVYAGAIVVLFLFVVMLLNLRTDVFPVARSRLPKLLGIALSGWALWVFLRLLAGALPAIRPAPEGFGGFRELGQALFTRYVLPFEVTSFLLLAAIVGAVILAKRRID